MDRWVRVGLWFGKTEPEGRVVGGMLANVWQLDLKNEMFWFVAIANFPAVSAFFVDDFKPPAWRHGVRSWEGTCTVGPWWLQCPTEAGRSDCSAAFLKRNHLLSQLRPYPSSAQWVTHRSRPLADRKPVCRKTVPTEKSSLSGNLNETQCKHF